MSNYHGCKGEAINIVSHYLIDIIPQNWNIQARENPTSILDRDKTLRNLKKYERMYHGG